MPEPAIAAWADIHFGEQFAAFLRVGRSQDRKQYVFNVGARPC
jgi:hypothetical protein